MPLVTKSGINYNDSQESDSEVESAELQEEEVEELLQPE